MVTFVQITTQGVDGKRIDSFDLHILRHFTIDNKLIVATTHTGHHISNWICLNSINRAYAGGKETSIHCASNLTWSGGVPRTYIRTLNDDAGRIRNEDDEKNCLNVHHRGWSRDSWPTRVRNVVHFALQERGEVGGGGGPLGQGGRDGLLITSKRLATFFLELMIFSLCLSMLYFPLFSCHSLRSVFCTIGGTNKYRRINWKKSYKKT